MNDGAQAAIALLFAAVLLSGTGFFVGRTLPAQDAYQTGYDRGRLDLSQNLKESTGLDADVFLRCAEEAFTDKKEDADE